MKENFEVIIDNENSTIVIITDKDYYCAIDVDDAFITKALECTTTSEINHLMIDQYAKYHE